MTPAKRILDLFFALWISVVLAPVILWLAILVWRRQGRPIFYVSERMKTPEQPFHLWKFRTMTVAENDRGVSGGDKRARITPLGAWMRARRLDEFPQLWNILRGDMSFVGPRPPLREYVEEFPDLYEQVLRARPGVTGLATLEFAHHEARLLARCRSPEETDRVYRRICVPRKARLDLIYLRHRNICFDFVLGCRTAARVFRGR